MRFGVAVPAYGRGLEGAHIRDLLQAADDLGFDSAWFPDHVAVPDYAAAENLDPPFLEPLASCAWGLGITTRLRFGTDVLVAAYRHPLVVAASAATLGRLAGDRFVLGVGIGYLRGEFSVLGAGPYEDRGRITDEFLDRLRHPPQGYSVVSSPTPVPVWAGGNGAAARRRAALLADGWHPLWMPDTDYATSRRQIVEARAAAGRDGPFTFSYSCGATRLLERRRDRWPPPVPPASPGSEFAYAPDPWLDNDGRPRFVGTPDQVAADLSLLQSAGVDHVTLRFGSTEVEQLERFAREVLPAFERR
jgi:alkanesulfonate monooxygenase SsuD/methylene tetrahydromethanopterin reductase-like flavin-dependent oxidoreductase (luciferase family)